MGVETSSRLWCELLPVRRQRHQNSTTASSLASDAPKKSIASEDSSDPLISNPAPAPAKNLRMVELGPLSKLPVTPGLPSKAPGSRRATETSPQLGRLGESLGLEAGLLGGDLNPKLGKMRDRRQVKSWSAGTQRREVLQPLRPHNYNSFAPGTAVDEMNASRTFGGIERSIRPTLPNVQEIESLTRWAEEYRKARKSSRQGEAKPTARVVAFVNSRSGGQVGQLLMRTLEEHLGGEKDYKTLVGSVCDLSQPHEPASTVDDVARDVRSGADIRLLVCGGDGTVTWILTALEQCRALNGKLHLLPVAIAPLGTGNDLARSLGWGPKLRQVADILTYLKWVVQAAPVVLDQWRLVLRPHEALDDSHKLRTCGSHPQLVSDPELSNQLLGDMREALEEDPLNPGRGDVYLGYWQNYFSVGVDAKVARYVDVSRSETSCGRCCFRRGCGKVCYAWQGLLHAAFGTILTQTIRLMKVTTPPEFGNDDRATMNPPLNERRVNGRRGRLRQLMFVNINSYGAGLQVQPDPSDCDRTPSPGDGILEVLGLRNVLSGLGVYAGLIKPTYFCSAEAVAFSLQRGECMQLDGEPWSMDCGCDVLVEPHRKVTMLRAPSESRWWRGSVVQNFWTEDDGTTSNCSTMLPQVTEEN